MHFGIFFDTISVLISAVQYTENSTSELMTFSITKTHDEILVVTLLIPKKHSVSRTHYEI